MVGISGATHQNLSLVAFTVTFVYIYNHTIHRNTNGLLVLSCANGPLLV